MRICLVHEEYPEETNFGGIATYQKNVAEELVKEGHIVYVLCRGLKEDKTYTENGVNVIRVFYPQDGSVLSYINYRKKVAEVVIKLQNDNLIDIIETPDWGAETYYFENYRKLPLVVRLHTPLKIWLKYNKNSFGKVKNNLLKWEKKMIKNADLVTCCSNALKKKITKNFRISAKKIIVTPNPADLQNFYCDKNIAKKNQIIYVGSLEQRKGVVILAKALNYLFAKEPNLQIEFVGKDTKRNVKNISTIEYIKQLVLPQYHGNLHFIGQIPNYDIVKHLNSSLVAVFPSLFDNFPYVVLEAMACGMHIVGSRNSGMVEMLNDNSSLYRTGNVKDLANKIEAKYALALKNNYNLANIKRVKGYYNKSSVCEKLVLLYKQVINNYKNVEDNLHDLQHILNNVSLSKILKVKREKNGVANIVYRLKTKEGYYIIKKYNYEYDFELINKLYDLYEKNNVLVIRPINKSPIFYQNHYYNIFPYLRHERMKIGSEYLSKIITINRKVKMDDTILKKCEFYYSHLKSQKINNIPEENVLYVLDVYKKLNKLKGNYLNHGDIQASNIISNHQNHYLIDFDEALVGPYLYDYAVIVIKMFTKRKVNNRKIKNLQKKIIDNNKNVTIEDFIRKILFAFYL